MNLPQQRSNLRDALLAILFLRAKLQAETGRVPDDIRRRVVELATALVNCTTALERQRTQQAIAEANERASTALADVEVELLLA